jgi:poly-gamma-glutamate capsule biosynthesis protein CapA/YwtB (metallophosphatase superfamily)
MLTIEVIKNKEYISYMGYVLTGGDWKKIEDMTQEKQPRTIKQLIRDFEKSAGDFEKFNKSMDLREQTLFRGWINQLRKEIPAFAYHGQHSN